MNSYALAVSWAKLGLIMEATGYLFGAPTANEYEGAEAYCKEASPWPVEGSIKIRSALAKSGVGNRCWSQSSSTKASRFFGPVTGVIDGGARAGRRVN